MCIECYFSFEFLKVINYFIFVISFWCGTKIKIFVQSFILIFWKKNFWKIDYISERVNRYRFVHSAFFCKSSIFPFFCEEILEFGLFKFFIRLCCWQKPRVRFLFLGVYWGCFVSLGMLIMVGLVISVA